jgi:hypothetical protein
MFNELLLLQYFAHGIIAINFAQFKSLVCLKYIHMTSTLATQPLQLGVSGTGKVRSGYTRSSGGIRTLK